MTSTELRRGTFTVQAQERVLFGQPAAEAVLAEVQRYAARRVFVVSTRSLSTLDAGSHLRGNDATATSSGLLQRIIAALGSYHVGTFGTVRSHSPREDIVAAAAQARAARADLLVAVGGGSAIDATKAVQLCLWLGLDSSESMEPYRTGLAPDVAKRVVVPEDPIRMIAVSTTLSASEFTASAGVTNTALNAKQSFAHRLLVPRSVILDPAATLPTPPWLLYSTGIRSVDHAVETFCSPLAHPATEALSLQGLRLLARALPQIERTPDALEPRLEAQFGMWQAIAPSASGVPTGASHGIGYVLGGTYGVPHGHTSCVMLPSVLRWNASVNGERQRALAAAMGAPDRDAADLVAELIAGLDQPGSLRAVGIKREQLDDIAQRALGFGPVRANPRAITSANDVKEILELAW